MSNDIEDRTARYRNELAQCDRDDRSAENAEMCAPALIFVSLGIAVASFAAHETIGHHRGDSGVRLAVGPEGQGDCSIGKAILHPTGIRRPLRVTPGAPLVRFGRRGCSGPASSETESSALAIARMPLLRDHCAERIGR
jgi:hypothetical protein